MLMELPHTGLWREPQVKIMSRFVRLGRGLRPLVPVAFDTDVGPRRSPGKVFAFEPNPELPPRSRYTIVLNWLTPACFPSLCRIRMPNPSPFVPPDDSGVCGKPRLIDGCLLYTGEDGPSL